GWDKLRSTCGAGCTAVMPHPVIDLLRDVPSELLDRNTPVRIATGLPVGRSSQSQPQIMAKNRGPERRRIPSRSGKRGGNQNGKVRNLGVNHRLRQSLGEAAGDLSEAPVFHLARTVENDEFVNAVGQLRGAHMFKQRGQRQPGLAVVWWRAGRNQA